MSFQYVCVPYSRRQTELILEFDLNLELSHPQLQQPCNFIASFPPALSTVLIIVFAANITSLEFTNIIASAISIAIDAWKIKFFFSHFPYYYMHAFKLFILFIFPLVSNRLIPKLTIDREPCTNNCFAGQTP